MGWEVNSKEKRLERARMDEVRRLSNFIIVACFRMAAVRMEKTCEFKIRFEGGLPM